MRIRPLTGQVLIEILPPDKRAGLIELPDPNPEWTEHTKQPPETGIVREIGPWPKTKSGLAMLPEFRVGQKVLVSPYKGQQIGKNIGDKSRLIKYKDVLAVLSED